MEYTLYAYTYVHTYICIQKYSTYTICMYIGVHCVCVTYICIYIHTYIYVHTHLCILYSFRVMELETMNQVSVYQHVMNCRSFDVYGCLYLLGARGEHCVSEGKGEGIGSGEGD